MKRILAIILTVSLIFVCFPVLPVLAENYNDVDIILGYKNSQFPTSSAEKYLDDWYFSHDSSIYQKNKDKEDGAITSFDIRLQKNITTKYFPTFRYADINIDLNGHTWKVTNAYSNSYNYKSITVSGGTLIFENSPSYPIYSYGGEIRMRNVVFKNCVCGEYGLICSESNPGGTTLPYGINKGGVPLIQSTAPLGEEAKPGSIQLDNVYFENCSSTYCGSCICIKSKKAKHTFNDCKFNNCTSVYGGAMYFEGNDTQINFFNCEFNNCSATTDGGVVYCESENSKLCFSKCIAYRCHADDCGGFIFGLGQKTVYNGFGDSTNSTLGQRSNIIGCYALDSGGAFYFSVNGNNSNYSEVRNFNMAYNVAGASTHNFDAVKSKNSNSWGGAVCFRGTDMKLAYCDLYSNYAPYYGGAVYCGYRRTSVENCSFSENRCSDGYGNDIYLDSATQYVTGCTFYTNGNSVAGYNAAKWENNVTTSNRNGNPFAGGNGSQKNPYKIYNAEQWQKFAYNVTAGETYSGKYIELTGDITIAYVPVGYYNQRKAFKGYFDGKNHTINFIDNCEFWDRGLFSYCVDATVKNVRVKGKIRGTVTLAGVCAAAVNSTFENCINDVSINAIGEPSVAGIVANATDCTFTNCTNNGTINCDKNFAGGIAAETAGKAVFTGCRNNGSISAKGLDVGGILGIAKNDVTVKKCVNNAPITAGDATAAGIVGSCQQGAEILSCINTEKGVISAKQYAAGILAWVAPSSYDINIKNCANCGEIKDTVGVCGGIAVNHKNDNMTVENCFNATTKIPYIAPSTVEIEDGDYIIASALDEKYAVDIQNGNNAKNIPGKNAHLWQNGDANVFSITKDNTKGTYIIKSKVTGLVLDVVNSSKENGANIQQWSSNGTDAQRWVFEAAGNGCYYIRCIGGQYMDASGMVNGAMPTNGVNIQSWSYTGAVNQQFKLVKVNDIADGDYIIYTALNEKMALDIEGGKGSVNVSGRNVHLWENGDANVFTVTKDKNKNAYTIKSKVTGLVLDVANGSKDNGANIQQWGSNGTDAQHWVFEYAGNGYYYIRWLGGQYMDVEAFNATSGGNIHSWQFTGADNQKFKIVAVGRKAASTTGAIVSSASKGAYKNCYYLSGGVGDKHATALSLADCKEKLMTKMNQYIADNTTSRDRIDWPYWIISERLGVTLPDIDNAGEYVIKGSGTETDPYQIESPEHLSELSRDVSVGVDYKGKYFKLTKNFTYSGAPVGEWEHPFTGNFEGNGHTLTVSITGGLTTALFGELKGATVKNLQVAGSVKGANCVGGIAGHAHGNSRIDNCLVTATVEGTAENVGGIVGMLDNSTVSNCRMEGSVSSGGSTSIGGIVGGIITSSKIINCVNMGRVTGNKAVGGIIGSVMWGDTIIVNCSSLGSTAEYTKNAGYEHGGIIGFINSEVNTVTVSGCFSKCAVGVSKDSGYIVGNNMKDENANVQGKAVKCKDIYYYKNNSGSATKVVGTGFATAITDNTAKKTALHISEALEALNLYTESNRKMIEGIPLTDWVQEEDITAIFPKNYVKMSSLTASVFSAQNLPILIVIVIGLVTGVVGVTVMYRKKKKKSSMIKQ